jgi:hypothetical protein
MSIYKVTAKARPNWRQIRWKVSNALLDLARWIYPENPEVKAFFMQMVMDQMIAGKAVMRVDPHRFDGKEGPGLEPLSDIK